MQLEDEDKDEFLGVDVQVEDEDEDDDEEEPNVKDYVYRETEFEQSDEENERVYGGFVVNEDEEYHEKEPSEADTDKYDTDDFSSVHESEDEENTTVRGNTKRRAPRFKQYYRDHDFRFPKFSLELEFTTMIECIEVVQYYANSCAKLLKFVKNELGRLRVKCNRKAEKGHYPWVTICISCWEESNC